jgi:FKBP-type peptidyl-prolyl cis-trans isomerase
METVSRVKVSGVIKQAQQPLFIATLEKIMTKINNIFKVVVVSFFVISCATKKDEVVKDISKISKISKIETSCVVDLSEIASDIWLRRPNGYDITDESQYFSDNNKKPEIVTLSSGIQYKVLRNGCGDSPTLNNTVKVRYHMTLLNGSIIDSSYNRKETPSFVLGTVIPGWHEAVSLMQRGEIWEVFIPSFLAYRSEGMGPVPKNAGLLFTVELIDFY